MVTTDIVTGSFELFASSFILNHVRVAWKNKQAYGMSMVSAFFFFAWAVWNLWFYPALNQWFAFYAGIAVVVANLIQILVIMWLRTTQSRVQ